MLSIALKLSFAQQPAYFKLGENEFSGVQIYDVIQDNKLNYWFATDQGFYKYDNYKFQLIECNEMKGFSAFGFVKDGNGIIYCYNLNNQIIKIENGTCKIFYEMKGDEKSNNISLAISNKNELAVLSKTSLVFNKNNVPAKFKASHSLYFGNSFTTKNGVIICHVSERDSLLKYENNKIELISCTKTNEKIGGVLYFYRINDKTFAISSRDKKIYSLNENTFQLTQLEQKSPFVPTEILRFYQADNELWTANITSGIRRYSSSNSLSETLFTNYFISDVFVDAEGNLLLSTFNNGVLVIPNLKTPDVLPNTKEKEIVSLNHDKELGILLGTSKGELINFKDNKYISISNKGIKPLQSIYNWDNFPYVIFDDGLMKMCDKKSKKITPLFEASLKDAICVNDTTLYLALNHGVCKIIINKNGKFQISFIDSLKTRTNSIEIEPKSKNIFVATSDGLKRIKPNGNLENIVFQNKQLFSNDLTLYNHTIYSPEKNHGLLILETDVSNNVRIKKINPNGTNIYKLIINKNNIYANTSKGFIIFDTLGNIKTQLNVSLGFSKLKIFDFEIINEELWICHSEGIQKIKLSNLEAKKTTPLISISTVKVNDSTLVNPTLEGLFDNSNRKFSFIISSPTLKNKENIKYHYKLIGYDNNWQTSTYYDNVITYNALTPGSYSFIVKAENQGVYTKEINYNFKIKHPFYARWWFISLSISLFLLIVYLIYRKQLNLQRKKSEQINELNASKLTAIQSQMNPHFIFNSLNSVQDLILKGDVEHSYTYITTFSNLVRRTLNYSEKDFIDFDQEIKLLELYLSLEKLRFKKDFNYEIIYKDIDEIMLPPLLVQPFIENALVHGLLHKEGAKNLKITFELKELLICTIEDNGVGREKAKAIKLRQRSEHESFSGRAIKKRFEILSNVFGGAFGYEYEDLYENNEGVGTKVILMIPIKHKF